MPLSLRRTAVLAVAALVVGCSGNEAGSAFAVPEGFARSGISVVPGTTAVVGLGVLQLVDADKAARLLSLRVEGEHVDAQAGRVLGVKLYPVLDGGAIGAVTAADLPAADGSAGWRLSPPADVVVDGHEVLGVAVVVAATSVGSWASDSLVVDYLMDGRHRTQRIAIGAAVCVVARAGESCDP